MIAHVAAREAVKDFAGGGGGVTGRGAARVGVGGGDN